MEAAVLATSMALWLLVTDTHSPLLFIAGAAESRCWVLEGLRQLHRDCLLPRIMDVFRPNMLFFTVIVSFAVSAGEYLLAAAISRHLLPQIQGCYDILTTAHAPGTWQHLHTSPML